MINLLRVLALICGLLQSLPSDAAADPLTVLKNDYPALWKLYQSYPGYHSGFKEYANSQGFRRPFENLATIIHETLHIDSLVHEGFFVDGTYYEPYLKQSAWPTITNKDVAQYMTEQEKGLIYRLYVLDTPNNTLGNIVDEINAYGHVIQFICHNEPESTDKQVTNLIGHLQVQEAYLRVLRTYLPMEYMRLSHSRESRGAITLITRRAWKALTGCGISKPIPAAEASYFMRLPVGQ